MRMTTKQIKRSEKTDMAGKYGIETLRGQKSLANMGRVKNGLAALIGLILLPQTALAGEVNIYNWYDYFPQEAIDAFAQKTRLDVNYDIYDSNEVLEAKLVSGKSGYDVVVPSASFLERQMKNGVYQPIDKSKLKNYSNLDTQLLAKVAEYDPGNRYSVPYAWGTVGIGYNVDMLEQRLGSLPKNSLDLLFNPEITAKLADCGIAVIDSPAEVTAVALNYLGLDPNSESKQDLKQASQLMRSVRGDYKYFNAGNYISDLASGDICIALGYNGGVMQAQAKAHSVGQGVNISYAIPKEGTAIWFDLMAIPADAPNPEQAHQFIDYVLEPKVGAGISNLVFYAVPNTAAKAHVIPEISGNKNIYPDPELQEKLFVLKAHTAKFDRILNRSWSNLKAKR